MSQLIKRRYQAPNLPFAKTDAEKLSQALERHGFSKLGVLTGSAATHDNFVVTLQKAQCRDSSSLVLVYYSGHGVVAPDNNELWLQLAGQPKLTDRLGITVRDIVGSARGNCYSGELSIIIDSCFSGEGVLTSGLTLREFGKKTSILTSSSDVEESYSTKKTNGSEISAFTDVLIKALTDGYEVADDNSDGFLVWDELSIYSQNELNLLLKDHLIPKRMEPHQLANPSSMFIAYDRSHIKHWNSPLRQLVAQTALGDSLALPATQLAIQNGSQVLPQTPLVISQEAQQLASEVVGTSSSYASGLKAIANRQFTTAREALEQACKDPSTDLRDCYLSLARNEMYAGQPDDAVHWYRKAMGFSLPLDIELQNETASALLQGGNTAEGTSLLSGLVRAQDALKLEDTRLATSLHNLATAELSSGKLIAAETNYKRALELYTKMGNATSIYASMTAADLADVYARNGNSLKESEYRSLSAQYALHRLDSLTSVVANLDNYRSVAETSVKFGFNKDSLTKKDKEILDQLSSQAENLKGYIIVVEGSADSAGSSEYNYDLSRRRANAVIEYLASQKNIPVHKIYLVGMGKDAPVASNQTSAGRANNRRVDVRLMTNAGENLNNPLEAPGSMRKPDTPH